MRLDEFQKRLDADIALFFNDDPNIRYFSGAPLESGCLAVPRSGKPLLFVPGFEADRMADVSSVEVVRVGKNLLDLAHSSFPAGLIGVNAARLSYANSFSVKNKWNASLISVDDLCRDLRVVKTPDEVFRVTKACAFTDFLFDELCRELPKLDSELDAAAFLKARMTQLGVEESFPVIVASGRNGAVPHHVPSNSRLSGFTVIDFGVVYKNYCSDMTRTVFIGTPSGKDKSVYNKLLSAQLACVNKVKPGSVLEDIDAFAKERVGKGMIHRVGHSLGIEVHDVQPRPMRLESGNIITIEPGTYGSFGIRIEDDVLVGRRGPVVLSKSPKSLLSISKI